MPEGKIRGADKMSANIESVPRVSDGPSLFA